MDAFRPASAGARLRHVFLHDMILLASVGVHAFEHEARQRLRINIDLAVLDEEAAPHRPAGPQSANLHPASLHSGEPRIVPRREDLSRVVDYEAVASRMRSIVLEGHVRLLETLAERLAEACLEDSRVRSVRVKVEKLDIFPDIAAVGIEIERRADAGQDDSIPRAP
jgi:dihydroneopterin aldolase